MFPLANFNYIMVKTLILLIGVLRYIILFIWYVKLNVEACFGGVLGAFCVFGVFGGVH